jgi:redox-sensing transcriptional repressor
VKKANKGRFRAASLSDNISELTTNRLSVPLRCPTPTRQACARSVARLLSSFTNAAQICGTLRISGESGVWGGLLRQGAATSLREILGIDKAVRVAIMGAGNLGLALADYPGFRDEGFEIAALFDTMREKVGRASRSGVAIYDIRELRTVVRRERITIAVIAVPAEAAQTVVNAVVSAGIKAVLNFSPGALRHRTSS